MQRRGHESRSASGFQRLGKAEKWILFYSLRNKPPSWHLDVDPVKLISDFLSPKLEQGNLYHFFFKIYLILAAFFVSLLYPPPSPFIHSFLKVLLFLSDHGTPTTQVEGSGT